MPPESQFICPLSAGFLYGMVHHPVERDTRPPNILVCQPLGNEWSNAYLPLIRLARTLARTGQRVFRFDYSGTGDSAGLFSDMDAPQFSKDILSLLEYIHRNYPAGPVTIIAFRAAALFICPLLNEPSVGNVYLVDPVLEPGKYVKELTVTDHVAIPGDDKAGEEEESGLNAGGYLFSTALIDSLLLAEPASGQLTHPKIAKLYFSKRGLLSNTKIKRLTADSLSGDIVEVDYGLDAFWNKHSVEGSAVLESKFSAWLS